MPRKRRSSQTAGYIAAGAYAAANRYRRNPGLVQQDLNKTRTFLRRLKKGPVSTALRTVYGTRRLNYRVAPEPSGAASRSSFKRTYKRSRSFYATLKQTTQSSMVRLEGENLTTDIGQQNAITFAGGKSAHWIDSFETAAGEDATTVTYDKTNRTQKYYPDYVNLVLNIANADLATAYVTLYIVEPRHDTDNNVSSIWTSDTTDRSYSTVNDGPLIPMSTPFTSPAVCADYKILRVIHIELPQGSSHIHTTTLKCNRRVNGSQIAREPNYVKGRCIQVMVTAYGAPVHDKDTETSVSTATVQLDIVSRLTCVTRMLSLSKAGSTTFNDLDSIAIEEFISQGGEEKTEGGTP